MKQYKSIKLFIVATIFLFIIFISIAYTTFSSQITILGTAKVRNSSWNIHFEDLSNIAIKGNAKEIIAPQINSTNTILTPFSIVFEDINDSISYTFKIVNDGTFDAILTTLLVPIPSCIIESTNTIVNECKEFGYTLTYIEDGSTVKVGDLLPSKSHTNVKLTLSYDKFISVEEIKISNLEMLMIYSQY